MKKVLLIALLFAAASCKSERRKRIDAALADQDPCAAERVRGEADAEGDSDLIETVAKRVKTCEVERNGVGCKALLEGLDEGRLSEEATAVVTALSRSGSVPLFQRVAMKKLVPTDLALTKDDLHVCNPTTSDAAWRAFVKAAGVSSDAWAAVIGPSSDLLKDLATTPLSKASLDALHTHAEKVAADASPAAKPADLEKPRALCSLETDLGGKNGPACAALETAWKTLAAREEKEAAKEKVKTDAAEKKCAAFFAAREACTKRCEKQFPFTGDAQQDEREIACEDRCTAAPVPDGC